MLDAARGENPNHVPSIGWFRTRKGRGYLKYDNKSHGSPHAMNSELFWELRKAFMAKYGMEYAGVDEPAPGDPAGVLEQAAENLRRAAGVLANHTASRRRDFRSSRRAGGARSPTRSPGSPFAAVAADVFSDPRLTDFRSYPGGDLSQARENGRRTAPRSAPGARG